MPENNRALRAKIMCGYQGWFRCPGDAANAGWAHWSRRSDRLAPDTLTVEMWPDMTEYGPGERFAAPGFTHPNGSPAYLFSSDNAATVLRHFRWMQQYEIDGVWLQHFLVDLPGGPLAVRYPSRLRVLHHVRAAAEKTNRVWALSYDIAGLPTEQIYDVLTNDWKRMVSDGTTGSSHYLRDGGKPVVLIWGFYYKNTSNRMTAELAARLIDFFKAPGPYQAYLVGGGDWNWRTNPDPTWRAFYQKFDAYIPWNIGNYTRDAGVKKASLGTWADDKRECERNGVLWIPTVYPGFGWDNLQQLPPDTSTIPRRGGQFLWEQFHALGQQNGSSVYLAMFDEVDEGTALFKVSDTPPTQAHFLTYEGLGSDWYLRLVREGVQMLRRKRPLSKTIPIKPKTSVR